MQRELLQGQLALLHRTVDILLERETINGSDLAAILGMHDPVTPALVTTGQRVMETSEDPTVMPHRAEASLASGFPQHPSAG